MPKPLSFPAFLLKTVYFSPIANPLYPLLGVILIILTISGDLTKHIVLLALFASGLSGMIIGPFLCIKDYKGLFRINPSILLLPLELKVLLKKAIISGAVYGAIISALLLVFMAMTLRIPNVQNPRISYIETPGKVQLPVLTGIVMSFDGRSEVAYRKVLDPSLIFGIVKIVEGYPVFPLWPICFFFLFTASTAYFASAAALRPFIQKKTILRVVHVVLLSLYSVIGLAILADAAIDAELLWHWRAFFDTVPFVLPIVSFLAGMLFCGGTLLQYRGSRNTVQG